MLTSLQGWESELDKRVISILEELFGTSCAVFRRIGEYDDNVYWHCRMHKSHEAVFVRSSPININVYHCTNRSEYPLQEDREAHIQAILNALDKLPPDLRRETIDQIRKMDAKSNVQ